MQSLASTLIFNGKQNWRIYRVFQKKMDRPCYFVAGVFLWWVTLLTTKWYAIDPFTFALQGTLCQRAKNIIMPKLQSCKVKYRIQIQFIIGG